MSKGAEFLGYARQVVEQAEPGRALSERKAFPAIFRYPRKDYAFAVNAFVKLVQEYGQDEYELALRETKTYEIIQDVKTLRIGILYLNEFNAKVINKC